MLKFPEIIRGVLLSPVSVGHLFLSFDIWASVLVFVPKSPSLETAHVTVYVVMSVRDWTCYVCEGLDSCCGILRG